MTKKAIGWNGEEYVEVYQIQFQKDGIVARDRKMKKLSDVTGLKEMFEEDETEPVFKSGKWSLFLDDKEE